MNNFKFGRKYNKPDQNKYNWIELKNIPFRDFSDYFNRILPEVRCMNYYTDNNKPQGFRGHNGKQKELKNIKKFHHKGKYPKPR
jgi:hypothetical protein